MRTRVKICGITTLDDAMFSAQAGADYLGFIFYAPSKRFIAPRTAGEIVRKVRLEFPHVQPVGVFVDDEIANVAWIRNLAGLDYVQLHGNESPEYCAELSALGIEIIKAIGVSSAGPQVNAAAYDAAFYLYDTHDDKLKGGTGRQFDIAALPPDLDPARMFLAGGLSPENVVQRLSQIHPYAVDVSSGVESSPGIKLHTQVKSFVDNVRTASAANDHKEQFQ